MFLGNMRTCFWALPLDHPHRSPRHHARLPGFGHEMFRHGVGAFRREEILVATFPVNPTSSMTSLSLSNRGHGLVVLEQPAQALAALNLRCRNHAKRRFILLLPLALRWFRLQHCGHQRVVVLRLVRAFLAIENDVAVRSSSG